MSARCWVLAKIAIVDDRLQVIGVTTASESPHTITHAGAYNMVELFHEEGDDYEEAYDNAQAAYLNSWWRAFNERFPL